MALTVMRQEQEDPSDETHPNQEASRAAFELRDADEGEVLDFLAERPIHTVFMGSLIRDNGLMSSLNRGTFFACRGNDGHLEGVALIGHATLVEARTDASLAAFARVAQNCTFARIIRGERDLVHSFWSHYARPQREPRMICGELMLEQRTPFLLRESIPELRQASSEDLRYVAEINAEMAAAEGGANPLERDPQGFLARTARRIEQGRVWIWVEDGKPMFKADLVSDTPQAVYLEGVYVHHEQRGKGYGLRCLTQLGWTLLARTEAICLTVNQRADNAAAFYYKAGYRLTSYYETVYLQ